LEEAQETSKHQPERKNANAMRAALLITAHWNMRHDAKQTIQTIIRRAGFVAARGRRRAA
jgi:hypothetical protein